eukprot:188785_1
MVKMLKMLTKECDVYELFNALQYGYWNRFSEKVFLDMRSAVEFDQKTTYESMNIPLSILNDIESELKLKQIINTLLKTKYHQQISIIYAFSNQQISTDNNHIQLCKYIRNILMNEFNINPQFIFLNTTFNAFYNKFPYICRSPKNVTENMVKQTYPSHIINDRLFLGNMDHATTKEVLKNLEITHVLNMTFQNNAFERGNDLKIQYLQCSLSDAPYESIQRYFDKGIEFIHNAMENNNKCLVHCQAGISRSSAMVIAYLMKIRKMTYEEAYKYTQQRREVIQPNDGFIAQLQWYEKNGCVVKSTKSPQILSPDSFFTKFRFQSRL